MRIGATYFFKNRDFWKFNDLRMRVEQEEPRSIGQFWFNCTAVDGGDQWPTAKNKGRVIVSKGSSGRSGRIQSSVDGSADDVPSSSSVDAIDRRLLLPVVVAIAAVRMLL